MSVRVVFFLTTVLFLLFSHSSIAENYFAHDVSAWPEETQNTMTQVPHREQDKAALPDIIQTTKKTQPSIIEDMYAERIVDELEQFGYDLFSDTNKKDKPTRTKPTAAVQDDFILHEGDRLSIKFTGQRKDKGIYEITSDGFLFIEDLPPLSAAGRAIHQIRKELKKQTEELHNTDVFVSLDSVREINVLVIGEVNKPGRQSLSVFHTVLDALSSGQGIKKTGSLRQIKLIRNGRSTHIDLYGLLLYGQDAMDTSLRDGDKIIVPSIGPTVAIAGGVKHPGIFEIRPALQGMWHKPEEKAEKLSLNNLLDMAGGVLSPADHRFLKIELTSSGTEQVKEIHDAFAPVFGDGTILMVARAKEEPSDMVELVGHTRIAGLHALNQTPTLSSLLSGTKAFGPDIYPLIGVIERKNHDQMTQELLAFPPRLVATGQYDRSLNDGDIIHLFSNKDIESLKKETLIATQPTSYGSAEDDNSQGNINSPLLSSFLKERFAFVRGAVRQEGAYPVSQGATLDNLIAVAGGLALEANTRNIEVTSAHFGQGHQTNGRSGTQRLSIDFSKTSPSSISITAGDTIRVNQKFHKIKDTHVLLIGEVLHPGEYDLLPDDTLSKLLLRAGGLTAQAYPKGTIFSRASERTREEKRYKAKARDLELKLAGLLEQKDRPSDSEIETVKDLVLQLQDAQAVGRITVEADPAVLSARPELDILLESGDKIFVPKRPLTVRVSGEVLSPAALQFRREHNARDYIGQAGGFTFHADKDRTFVVYPDGSAQPLQVNVWNHKPVFVPPGSTIIVPRDPKPFNFIESAKDISQILSNLALTGIWIDDLQND